jgi:hypothetical protein
VSARAYSNTEAWVVNTISDSISVVNLTTFDMTRTINTGGAAEGRHHSQEGRYRTLDGRQHRRLDGLHFGHQGRTDKPGLG